MKGSTLYLLQAVLAIQLFHSCQSFSPAVFGFQLPKFQFPWDNNDNSDGTRTSKPYKSSALQPGDTVAVIGASGNIGKLVALRLSDTYKVNGVVRTIRPELQQFFQGREDRIQLYESDLSNTADEAATASLYAALKDANGIVICTGTTAYPTAAWSKNKEANVGGEVLKALLDNKFSMQDAMKTLDALNLNTPNNVDFKANVALLDAWRQQGKAQKKRAIMLSSIGVQRRDTMPFPVLNLCGVLDAKAAGEAALIQAAESEGYSYTIIRPGQLFGGPYDNNYNNLESLIQLDEDSGDITFGKGDELIGDTLRSTLAEITGQICEEDCARDIDFAVMNVKGDVPSIEVVQERLKAL